MIVGVNEEVGVVRIGWEESSREGEWSYDELGSLDNSTREVREVLPQWGKVGLGEGDEVVIVGNGRVKAEPTESVLGMTYDSCRNLWMKVD